nr:response regulator [Sphingomonas yunnanensis]
MLIVEDHDELVTLLRRLLGEAGYGSDHVATVEDALLMLELGSYAAVVLDIGLPDPDGREVARRLRARGDGWLRRALRGLRWRSAFAAAAITRSVERERA